MTLNIDLVTLILKLVLDMVKMQHHTKNKVSRSTAPEVIAQTDAQTDTHTHTHAHTHTHTHTTKTLPLPHTLEVNTPIHNNLQLFEY